jgi:cyclopropane-fatty-acyl-phospholipid synthase
MTTATLPAQSSTKPPRAARIVFELLERFTHGALRIELPDGGVRSFGQGEPSASLRVHDWSVFEAALRRGDIGFGEAWIEARWQTDDLAGLLSLMLANRSALEQAIYGTWWGQILDRIRHLFNRNSHAGSRRNIAAHYDLGNDFYRLWLDPGMTYSSALYAGDPARSLEMAQQAKYARVIDELRLSPGQSMLEIGCGWGAMAEAAGARGLSVTGLTLSAEQLRHASDRLRRAGHDRAQILLQDYRDERRQYDGIASIEMFEAVGEAWWPAYFDCLRRCLRPGGRAVIQTIVIADPLFDRYRRGTDFIQQYVFPGGMLPSPSRFEALARQAGLEVRSRFEFGQDYARTLAIWRERFMAALPEVRAQGFDDRFIRTWEFYLAYCEAGFRERSTDVIQYTLEAPAP